MVKKKKDPQEINGFRRAVIAIKTAQNQSIFEYHKSLFGPHDYGFGYGYCEAFKLFKKWAESRKK